MRPIAICLVTSVAFAGTLRGDDWPQWMGPTRDGQWRETGILDTFPKDGPKILWRVPVAGGYAGPAVVGSRVYVTDYVTTGDTSANPGKRNKLEGTERVLCLDAKDGSIVWKHEYNCPYEISYPAGPRCTPTVSGGKVYTLGAEGNLFCFDAEKGGILWSKELKQEYQIKAPYWGFAGHPLVDGKMLYCLVGGEGSVAVAFDKDTGNEIWKSLPLAESGYVPPTMIEAGGRRQLVIWHAESINGLDPETGKVFWTVPLAPSFQMPIMSPRQQGDLLYAGGVGDQGVLLKLDPSKPAVSEVWRGKKDTAIYGVCSTPIVDGGTMYGVCTNGELRGVEFATGKRLWQTYAPTTGGRRANSGTAFLVRNGEKYFLMSETGKLFIAKLSPRGYEELDSAKILEPTTDAFGRPVVWSHPAFANRCMYARNDKELVCVSLAAE